MIVVIQCQGRKQHDAARLRSASGLSIYFVGHPELAPPNSTVLYARPDDKSDFGPTWRQVLLGYNSTPGNPQHLYTAAQLYADAVYQRLAARYGIQNFYILSAGWGLIRGDFLTPDYSITFSQSARGAKAFMRRGKLDRYQDFRTLPTETYEDVLFFGSREYVPLFCSLTNDVKGRRTVYYHAAQAPDAPGCTLRKFTEAKRETNWQFDCANAFLDGTIEDG